MDILAAKNLLDTTSYHIQLLVHIAFVAVWLGSSVSLALASSSAGKQGGPVLTWFAGVSKVLNMRVKSVAFVMLFISGMGLIGMSNDLFDYGEPFVSVGFAAIIIGGAIGGMVHAPASKALAEAAENGDAQSARKAASKASLANGVEVVIVLITMFMMIHAR